MKNIIIGILGLLVIVLGLQAFIGNTDNAANETEEQAAADEADLGNVGLVRVEREQSFASTTAAIRSAIESNENLTLMTEVDHQTNAAGADLQLRPTTLFIFGNPNAGTPLMRESASTGIDLPQKMLVTERNGEVSVYYNAPSFVANRHSITDQDKRLDTIAGLLEGISEAGN